MTNYNYIICEYSQQTGEKFRGSGDFENFSEEDLMKIVSKLSNNGYFNNSSKSGSFYIHSTLNNEILLDGYNQAEIFGYFYGKDGARPEDQNYFIILFLKSNEHLNINENWRSLLGKLSNNVNASILETNSSEENYFENNYKKYSRIALKIISLLMDNHFSKTINLLYNDSPKKIEIIVDCIYYLLPLRYRKLFSYQIDGLKNDVVSLYITSNKSNINDTFVTLDSILNIDLTSLDGYFIYTDMYQDKNMLNSILGIDLHDKILKYDVNSEPAHCLKVLSVLYSLGKLDSKLSLDDFIPVVNDYASLDFSSALNCHGHDNLFSVFQKIQLMRDTNKAYIELLKIILLSQLRRFDDLNNADNYNAITEAIKISSFFFSDDNLNNVNITKLVNDLIQDYFDDLFLALILGETYVIEDINDDSDFTRQIKEKIREKLDNNELLIRLQNIFQTLPVSLYEYLKDNNIINNYATKTQYISYLMKKIDYLVNKYIDSLNLDEAEVYYSNSSEDVRRLILLSLPKWFSKNGEINNKLVLQYIDSPMINGLKTYNLDITNAPMVKKLLDTINHLSKINEFIKFDISTFLNSQKYFIEYSNMISERNVEAEVRADVDKNKKILCVPFIVVALVNIVINLTLYFILGQYALIGFSTIIIAFVMTLLINLKFYGIEERKKAKILYISMIIATTMPLVIALLTTIIYMAL